MPPAGRRHTRMPTSRNVDLLDTAAVGDYLVDHHLADDRAAIRVRSLGGGVSNVVLAVDTGSRHLVVKQSLEQLRVASQWLAPRDRVITEAEGLRMAGRLTPGTVPAVLHADADRCVIVIEQAPARWTDWKSRLLTRSPGTGERAVAARLGGLLAAWQNATRAGLGPRFTDPAAFDALRIDPYYRTVATALPEYAEAVDGYAAQLASRRLCLSHGDFSPKNILVGPRRTWVIDFEVAHLGDPAFDVAFLLTHLLLKTLHRPAWSDGYMACAEDFTSVYSNIVDPVLAPDWGYVTGHVGCLLLARVDGKSPAEYLTESQRRRARALGGALLAAPPRHPAGLWEVLARIEES